MEYFLHFAEEFMDKVNVQVRTDWLTQIHGNLCLQFFLSKLQLISMERKKA